MTLTGIFERILSYKASSSANGLFLPDILASVDDYEYIIELRDRVPVIGVPDIPDHSRSVRKQPTRSCSHFREFKLGGPLPLVLKIGVRVFGVVQLSTEISLNIFTRFIRIDLGFLLYLC